MKSFNHMKDFQSKSHSSVSSESRKWDLLSAQTSYEQLPTGKKYEEVKQACCSYDPSV